MDYQDCCTTQSFKTHVCQYYPPDKKKKNDMNYWCNASEQNDGASCLFHAYTHTGDTSGQNFQMKKSVQMRNISASLLLLICFSYNATRCKQKEKMSRKALDERNGCGRVFLGNVVVFTWMWIWFASEQQSKVNKVHSLKLMLTLTAVTAVAAFRDHFVSWSSIWAEWGGLGFMPSAIYGLLKVY